ncbi:hypothetical protein GCM10027063_10110 [Promicromonospora xylanilytica]
MPTRDLQEPTPAELRTEEFVLRPITADDARLDHAAVMETREHLRLWEQSSWPEDDFTVEANRADLVDLEERHAAARAFTYTVLDPLRTECLGCVYVFPTNAAFLTRAAVTPVGDDEWARVQAVVYFWVRRSRVEAGSETGLETGLQTGLDGRLLAALRAWFADAWGLERTVFVTNEQFTQQVDLIERTDLSRRFELVEPGKPGVYLVFG